MKIPGSIYISKKDIYIALYNFWPDIYRKAPPETRKISNYVAHISYSFGGRSRGIDIFLVHEPEPNMLSKVSESSILNEIDIKRILIENEKENLGYTDKEHNIIAEIISKCDVKTVLNLVRKDIKDFTRNPAKNPGRNKITLVDKIIPKTKIRKIKQKQYLRTGKQDFVPSCSLEANLDFSWGCPSGFVPEPDSSFDGKYFINYFLDPFSECEYCYSIYQHKSFSKYLLNIDKKQLKEELVYGSFIGANGKVRKGKIKVLRLGKRTEVGSKFALDSLVLTLETCLETGTRIIMPTKYLEFDKEIAKLFKRTNSVALYSITGFDNLEHGACAYSCTNDWRLEQARAYREAGVNSVSYLHIDLPHEPTEYGYRILKFAEKYRIPVQLLSMRIPSKEIAKKVTGSSWNELKTSNRQLLLGGIHESQNRGGYEYIKGGMLVAYEIHPFYKALIKDNTGSVRLCHHDRINTYCGRCFLDDKGFIIPTQHVEIDYQKFREGNWKKRKKPWNIIPLFEHI